MMKDLQNQFNPTSNSTYFPFYIIMDKDFNVIFFSKVLSSLIPQLKNNSSFFDFFSIQSTNFSINNLDEVKNIFSKILIIKVLKNKSLQISGQFNDYNDLLLFVGAPTIWFEENKTSAFDSIFFENIFSEIKIERGELVHHQDFKELVKKIEHSEGVFNRGEERLKELSLETNSDSSAIILTDSNGCIFWSNDAYMRLTKFENSEILNVTLLDLIASNDSDSKVLEIITSSLQKGIDFDCQVFHKKKNEYSFWSRIKGQAVYDSKGIVIQYVVIVEDITKGINNQDRLKESEIRLSSLVMNLQKGVMLEDENQKILLVNADFCSMFSIDVDPKLMVGVDCSKSANQVKYLFNNSEQFVDRINQIIEKKEMVLNEEIELKDGRYFERSFIPFFTDGKYIGHLWSYSDITIIKNYNQRVNYEKGKYRRIIANMNIGLLEVDNEDTIILANQSFADMSGYTIEELIGKKGAELFLDAPSKQMLIDKDLERKAGKSDSYEIKIKNKQGEIKHWLISGAPNYNINGEVIGSIGIHLDITEQKNQEEQLILLSLIAEKNINSVIICDNQGKIEWVNNSFTSMSEYTFEDAIGKKPGHLLQGKDSNLDQIHYLRAQIRNGLPFKCELINYKKSGEKYWVKIQGQALYNKEGKILKYFSIQEDISSNKKLKMQKEELANSVAKTNKDLESYALIASHDLKAPIRGIYSLVTCIKEDNNLNDQSVKYLNIIEEKLEKMDNQIEDILDYAQIDKDDFIYEEVNSNEIIETCLEDLRIPKNVKFQIIQPLPILHADRFRLYQLFQNVISNSVNFIDKPEGVIEINYTESQNSYVFSVKDNGRGIAKENQHQIFNVSKYINNNERSNSLGLSIAKKIVEMFNGRIWIESELGLGTTFFIELIK